MTDGHVKTALRLLVAAGSGILTAAALGCNLGAAPSAPGGPATPVATRGSVAADAGLVALIPVEQLPAGFREVGRGPAAFPAPDGEAPSSASVAYQDASGNRITFVIVRVERAQLARNRLAFFALRYQGPEPGCGPLSGGAESGCDWVESSPAPAGDTSRSFVSSPESGGVNGTADLFVRGSMMALVEVRAQPVSEAFAARGAILSALDARLRAVQP
jgi:hypothetical protein